jgi:hypothetical protein
MTLRAVGPADLTGGTPISRFAQVTFATAILFVGITRFRLDDAPPSLYLDETAIALTARSHGTIEGDLREADADQPGLHLRLVRPPPRGAALPSSLHRESPLHGRRSGGGETSEDDRARGRP